MSTKIKVKGFECVVAPYPGSSIITYLIYPALEQLESKWLERMAEVHKENVAMVYVPAEEWNDALTPWPEPGEAKGCPPFAGKAPEFLKLLQEEIIPEVEKTCGLSGNFTRNLIGVSLSGLFTLWQWLLNDTFDSIACLSGSFWYVGFLEWFEKQAIPQKTGQAYFLLGVEEPHSNVKAFQCVGVNTEAIVERLKNSGIKVEFEWVPGNHFSRPVHRAEKALAALSPS
ncbi:MAG: hypothetical protein J1D77_07325 [Muribaculaceae bacterium]|nr:hypothetical protein [Muribaculaceae bacterium]